MAVSPEVIKKPFEPNEATRAALEARDQLIILDSREDTGSEDYQTDKTILARALNRFATLTLPSMERRALSITGNLEHAQEIVQETYAKAVARLRDFEGASQVESWMHRIMINKWKDRLAKIDVRKRKQEDIEATYMADRVFEPDLDPEQLVIDMESQQLLADDLREVSDKKRGAIVLQHVLGFSLEETAAILDRRIGTVKAEAHRGRKRLKEIWETKNKSS